jgi:hypothetical protein
VIIKFPSNPFPRIDPKKFTKFNKKRVTEDFVQINLERQGWTVYEPFQDVGIDRIATIIDKKSNKKIIRFIQIKTREIEVSSKDKFSFDYTLKPKDIICDPRITFLFYSDYTEDFIIFSINDYLELCDKANFTRSHFGVPAFKFCNHRVGPIIYEKFDKKKGSWKFKNEDLSNYLNEKGLDRIKNAEIDNNKDLFLSKMKKISSFRRKHFFVFEYAKKNASNNSLLPEQVEIINKYIKNFLNLKKNEILKTYKNNEKIKDNLSKEIKESMNLYLNNNIFETAGFKE